MGTTPPDRRALANPEGGTLLSTLRRLRDAEGRWWVDASLWSALLAGLVIRVLPLVVWGMRGCMRDECSYKVIARRIARGEGFSSADAGWLWAPGYPHLLALFSLIDSVYRVKRVQVALALIGIVVLYTLVRRVYDRRSARVAAWLMAIHPTLAFFSGRLWTEAVYGFLLVVAVAALVWAREGAWKRALVPGLFLGLCVLFRGVATYMAPVFVIGLFWPDGGGWRRAVVARWRHAVTVVAVAVVIVAPWSIHATQEYGGPVVSDASLGQVMYIGDNDFPLTTYDYGNGIIGGGAWRHHYRKGRAHCSREMPAAAWNRCEVSNGIDWILANRAEFVSRVPQRLAQLLNPNTFLTRHARTGKMPGLPWWAKELLVAGTALCSLLVILGGTLGAWARARGPYGAVAIGIVAYHLLAVAGLFGLSRFRAPLEPLWLVFLAVLVAHPRHAWAALRASPGRLIGAIVTLSLLVPLTLWYLPAGFPGWWR